MFNKLDMFLSKLDISWNKLYILLNKFYVFVGTKNIRFLNRDLSLG
jgi:hypothetical protein